MTITQIIAEASKVEVYVEAGNGLSFAVSKSSVRASGIAKAGQVMVDDGDEIRGYDSDSGATLWAYCVDSKRLLIG
jgi:hypothetical protein